MKKQFSRRDFLLMGSTATFAAALPSPLLAAANSVTEKAEVTAAAKAASTTTAASTAASDNTATTPQIAVQLYTVRDAIAKNMPSTFHKLADIGIHTIETAFWPKNITPKQAAKALKAAGLKVCSSHIELPIREKRAAMLETAEAFDCKRLIWHGWPEDKRYSSVDGTKQLIEEYNEAGTYAKSQGLQLGLHNHWWEYRNKPGGRPVYEYLLEGVSNDVFFELDTYWIKVAGHDPATIIKKFGPRAKYLHMKDGPAVFNEKLISDHPDPMVPLGKGTQNVPAIAATAKPNIEWMVIEMDVLATDIYQAIKDSKDYLLQHKFATN